MLMLVPVPITAFVPPVIVTPLVVVVKSPRFVNCKKSEEFKPSSKSAFKLSTLVKEFTKKGAVPVVTVEVKEGAITLFENVFVPAIV